MLHNSSFLKSVIKMFLTQGVQLKNLVIRKAYLPLLMLPPVAPSPMVLVLPELSPGLSRARGFELMSTDIASHRHARHRFGMRRDASVLAYFLTHMHMSEAGFYSNVVMVNVLLCRLDLLMTLRVD